MKAFQALIVVAFMVIASTAISTRRVSEMSLLSKRFAMGRMVMDKDPSTSAGVVLDQAAGVLSDKIMSIRNAVVQVVTTQSMFNWQAPWQVDADSVMSGTGFFVKLRKRPFIITNAHVVDQSASVIIRIPSLGQEEFPVQVFAVCHDKDIALLRLEDSESTDRLHKMLKAAGSKIEFLEVGNSDGFQQGSVAIAVGYPLGQANLKFSTGILSGREHVDDRYYLQTTSPINPGNSGGPLMNSKGVVMGINTAAIEKASNVGYSIPVSHIMELLDSFVAPLDSDPHYNVTTSSSVKRFPVLGVDLNTVTPQTAEYLGYKGEGGVYVRTVFPFGIMKDAGVQPKDMLLSFDGHALTRFGTTVSKGLAESLNIYDLAERIRIGKKIDIRVWRNNTELTLSAIFKASPKFYPVAWVDEPLKQDVNDYETFSGLVFMDLTLNHVVMLHTYSSSLGPYYEDSDVTPRLHPRVVVTQVLQGSPAADNSALSAGDCVAKINGVVVNTLAEFRENFFPKNFKDRKAGEKIFWTLETLRGSIFVVDLEQAIVEEPSLSAVYRYPLSDLIKEELIAVLLKKGKLKIHASTEKPSENPTEKPTEKPEQSE